MSVFNFEIKPLGSDNGESCVCFFLDIMALSYNLTYTAYPILPSASSVLSLLSATSVDFSHVRCV